MMNTVWCKVWRDLSLNKARTAMVVLSIAVGIFALGVIFGAYGAIEDYLAECHQAWIPVHITFWGSPFDETVEDVLLDEPTVADVERMVDTSFRWKLEGEEDWRNGDLYARLDYEAQRMGRVELYDGRWPTDRTLAIERMTARHQGIPIGTTIVVQVGQRERRLAVVGIIRDSFADPPQFGATPLFFTTQETATWLSGEDVNRLDLRLASYRGVDDAQEVIDDLAERVERVGLSVQVWGSWLRDPSEHWFQENVDTVYNILVVLGGLAMALSAFLIVNTMNAIVSQQVWQVGLIKTIGATFWRVVGLYLRISLVYSVMALLLAVPLGAVGAHLLARWILDIVNITVGSLRVVPLSVGIQVAVGLTVPMVAAAVPIINGARITAHQALSTYGLGTGFGAGPLDRLVSRIGRIPRPMALSLRNTFRHKVRVSLTLTTLMLGGAMFIMVLSVDGSLNRTIDILLHDFGDDVSIWLEDIYRIERVIEVAESVPGVVTAEVWRPYGVMMKLEDGGEHYLQLWGIPPDTNIVHPRIVSGRMLTPEDDHAIVLNHKTATDEGVQVGDQIRFDLRDEETVWTVVGLFKSARSDYDNYVPFDTLAREVAALNRGNNVRVVGQAHDPESQNRLMQALSDAYTAANIGTSYRETATERREDRRGGFDIVLYLLLGLAILAAVVGGLGLMSTMSINVLERRREIGVMRASGATSPDIASIVVVEGVLLGTLSWLLAVPVSVPLARLLSDVIGENLIYTTLEFTYSVSGMLIWLVVVILLSALSSLAPALQATRISVREALAYE
jgi:putative ABC transport system permease protein